MPSSCTAKRLAATGWQATLASLRLWTTTAAAKLLWSLTAGMCPLLWCSCGILVGATAQLTTPWSSKCLVFSLRCRPVLCCSLLVWHPCLLFLLMLGLLCGSLSAM